MDDNLSFVINNIIFKSEYSSELGKYVIREKDYLDLNLSEAKMKILRKLCNKLDIELEHKVYSSFRVDCVCDSNLFSEYNNIRDMLLNDLDSFNRDKLEARRIEIRNKILEDNMFVIDSLVDRRIDNIKSDNEREEIYHIGYLLLLTYIDNSYLYVDKFKKDVSQTIMLSLKRKVILLREGIDETESKYLDKLENFGVSYEYLSSSDVSKKFRVKLGKASEILNLAMVINGLSYEELLENDNLEYCYDVFDGYNDDKSKKDVISKLILCLPLNNQIIMSLYFGFGDYDGKSTIEIAKIVGLSKQRVLQIINDSLFILRSRVIVNELEKLSGKSISNYLVMDNSKKLELFLVMNLSSNYHDYLLTTFKSDFYREFYRFYFIERYSSDEICSIFNISSNRFAAIKYKVLDIVRYQINIYLMRESHESISYDDYMEYLMNIYLTKDNMITKKKIIN